jgi:hypothetical protein
MALEDLFGSPDYLRQLLGEEQFNKARQSALNQGIINASLQLLAGTPPSFDNRNATQRLVAQAGQAGLQGYQGAMDRTLTDMAKSMQVQEMMGRQKSRQALRGAYQQATTPQVSIGSMTSSDPVTRQLMQENMAMGDTGLESLARSANYAVQGTGAEAQPVVRSSGEFDAAKFAQTAIASGANPEDVNAFIKSVQGERTKLGQGEVLVDASGKVVARGDVKPDKVDLGNAVAFVDPKTLQVIKTMPKTQEGGSNFSQENTLRSQYLTQTQSYTGIAQAFNKIAAAAKDPSAAGDLSLIFGYMKILDPASVVREGEFATAQNAAGIPTQVSNMYNKVISGERLSESQRADFINQARNLVKSQKGQLDNFNATYKDIASNYKLDPEKIIIDPFKGIDLEKPIIVGKPKDEPRKAPTIRELMSTDFRNRATVRKID